MFYLYFLFRNNLFLTNKAVGLDIQNTFNEFYGKGCKNFHRETDKGVEI